jgi:hypothetical protein
VRLRWTGARRDGHADAGLTRRVVRRRRNRSGVYGGLIFVFVTVAFILQFQWMQRVRRSGQTDIVPESFASAIRSWMLRRSGIAPEEYDPSLEQFGIERRDCATCMTSGTVTGPDGQAGICPVCLGVGFRMIRRFDAADDLCPACAGMGRVELPDTGEVGVCPRCTGRGLIRRQGPAAAAADGE